MGEAVAEEKAATPPSAQEEAIVAAAARLEEACRDLTACLRALPGLAERRAAALLLRAAAVSGRLHLKDAIRLLDSAWEGDQQGPLCGEPRVVPETPEDGSQAGDSDREDPLSNGRTAGSEGVKEQGLQKGLTNGSGAKDQKLDSASARDGDQVSSKRKKCSSDSDSAKSPEKALTEKKRCVDLEGGEPPTNGRKTSLVKTEPCEEPQPGLVIAKAEPLSEPVDSQEAVVKTEPNVESEHEPKAEAEATEEATPGGSLPTDTDLSRTVSPSPNPEGQNERDRLALMLSSEEDDDDDPGGVLPAGGDASDSESTVVRSGDEAGGASAAASSDSESRRGSRLRQRVAKDEPISAGSDCSDRETRKKGTHRRRYAKKYTDRESDSDRKPRRSRSQRRRASSDSLSTSGEDDTDGRRRRGGPNRSVSNSPMSSDSESGAARYSKRRGRRRRRPRGPPEPTANCSVVLTRLPSDIVREAAENGFVKVTKRAKKQLSEETLQIRRLANLAAVLRTSVMKGGGSSDSDDSSEEDSEKEARKKANKSAGKGTSKLQKKKRKTLKDMSDGDSHGRPSGNETDDSLRPPSGLLVPMEENQFDRDMLLASDSGSDADSESVEEDDSDFVPSEKLSKKKAKLKKEAKDSEGENNDSEDGDKGKNKKKPKKKTESKSEGDSSDGGKSGNDGKAEKKGKGVNDSEDDKGDERKEKSDEGEEKTKKKKRKEGDEVVNGEETEAGRGGDQSGSNASDPEADESESKDKNKKLSAKVRQLLNGRMSATDSSEEDEKMKEKMLAKRAKEAEKAAKAKTSSDKSDADEASDDLPTLVNLPSSEEEEVVEKKRTPRKKRMRVVDDSDSDLCVLDSDMAESEEEEAGPSKKRGRSSSSISSVSDSADDFKAPKKTRSRARLKRIRRMSDDSVSSSSDDSIEEVKPESQGTPGKHGRKNIRHIREAEQSTKEASQAELERRKRIEDKQAKYNELFKASGASDEPAASDKLILDFDPETKKSLVSVNKSFVKILKPHQVQGVKFMFDSTIESVSRLQDESNQDNAGCILGHCMGLGKTLQVVVLLHTLLESSATRGNIACALVVCPKNTVQNWVRELKNWQKKCRVPEVDVVDITFRKDNYERSFELEQWQTEGGVCVLSYDMYKRFSGTGGKKGYVKKQKDRFQKALVDPGPDIVVCDEGHLLKNPRTAAFKSLNQMKCRRRVILTGTPLQNNLREYHTMVEFVKPRLLGSESEFSNRFIRPIENGSAVDALPRDVKLMKRRSHVLHKLLNSVVQRRDYSVLRPFLPPKLEFTLMVKLSDLQKKLYESYLEKARSQTTRKVLSDFQALSRVWTHPRSIQMKDEQDDVKEEMKSERMAMEKFVAADDSTTEEEDSKDGSAEGEENAANGDQAADSEWWRSCIPEDMQFEDPKLSGKLMLLDQLLIKCENIGDKLLVFSQSLFTLNLIEEHLGRLHKDMQRCRNSEKKHPSHVYFGTWKEDYDYFRLDGSTSEERRQLMCDRINKASNERARLMLISTKAGGLGINLVGANRVVIFDASWNPTADSQAIFRVYRFGQVKPCYVYRFIAQGCMEEKIYDRQISKLSLSCRVVDEQQVERHFNQHDVEELYEFEPDRKRATGLIVPKDDLVLMELVSEQSQWVSSVHGHDSLLQNVEDEELNAEEQRAAWEEYENDRRGIPNMGDIIPLIEGKAIDKATVIEMIKKDNPTATDNEVLLMIPKAIQTLRAYYFKKQQQEQRAREEQYRKVLEMQRQAMFAQHARQSGNKVDMNTYAQLLERMAHHQRTAGSSQPPAAHGRPLTTPASRQQAAAAAAAAAAPASQGTSAPVLGRQRTAHLPGPAHHGKHLAAALQRPPGTNTSTNSGIRALTEAAAATRQAIEARLAGATRQAIETRLVGGSGSGSGGSGTSTPVTLPKQLSVHPVKDKKGKDSSKSDKPTKPPDVVDIT